MLPKSVFERFRRLAEAEGVQVEELIVERLVGDLDPKTIEELGLLETPYIVELVLADKRKIKAKLFLAEVEVAGRRGPVFVAEVDTPTPLLRVYALETLGFKVDPKTGRLEEISPEGGYLL